MFNFQGANQLKNAEFSRKTSIMFYVKKDDFT